MIEDGKALPSLRLRQRNRQGHRRVDCLRATSAAARLNAPPILGWAPRRKQTHKRKKNLSTRKPVDDRFRGAYLRLVSFFLLVHGSAEYRNAGTKEERTSLPRPTIPLASLNGSAAYCSSFRCSAPLCVAQTAAQSGRHMCDTIVLARSTGAQNRFPSSTCARTRRATSQRLVQQLLQPPQRKVYRGS